MFDLFRRDTGKAVHVNDLEQLGPVELIDIREPYEFRSEALKTAKNIPMADLLGAPDKYLKQEKTYYIMCQSGARSSRACSILRRRGYDVVNVSGGMGSYVGTRRK